MICNNTLAPLRNADMFSLSLLSRSTHALAKAYLDKHGVYINPSEDGKIFLPRKALISIHCVNEKYLRTKANAGKSFRYAEEYCLALVSRLPPSVEVLYMDLWSVYTDEYPRNCAIREVLPYKGTVSIEYPHRGYRRVKRKLASPYRVGHVKRLNMPDWFMNNLESLPAGVVHLHLTHCINGFKCLKSVAPSRVFDTITLKGFHSRNVPSFFPARCKRLVLGKYLRTADPIHHRHGTSVCFAGELVVRAYSSYIGEATGVHTLRIERSAEEIILYEPFPDLKALYMDSLAHIKLTAPRLERVVFGPLCSDNAIGVIPNHQRVKSISFWISKETMQLAKGVRPLFHARLQSVAPNATAPLDTTTPHCKKSIEFVKYIADYVGNRSYTAFLNHTDCFNPLNFTISII